MANNSDEQIIEIAWQTAQVGSTQLHEEELCWALLERERAYHNPVVIAEVGVAAFVFPAEVK